MKLQLLAVLLTSAALFAGCSTNGPEQRCRDRSDATASISYDYCVWNKETVTSNDRQRTPGEWNNIVTWPTPSRSPASTKSLAAERVFR